ncbi:hypothetical protein DV515_00011712 [Chloebia gouldiae]|uniref:Pancreatic progenitor cell differentiation and proliferation factor n=1 Tax=Chloebia gouldiae TaxID=44316 RepID=A0A3L8S713_CHLGU|nr:hypothetical protein DV515_00011712 [Chloebia gouldiae]
MMAGACRGTPPLALAVPPGVSGADKAAGRSGRAAPRLRPCGASDRRPPCRTACPARSPHTAQPKEGKNFSRSELELNRIKGEGWAGLSRLWVMGRLLRTGWGCNFSQEHPRFRSAQEPRSGTMASIPSSGSLVAMHNYHRRRLSSTSSTSSCSSEFSGEIIPHGPDLPKSDPGQWWASFFFGKTTHPAMTTVSESQQSLGALRVATAPVACGLVAAPGAGQRRQGSESSAGPR